MRKIERNGVTVFEDRPIVLPAILAVSSLVFAVGLTTRIEALLAGEQEAIGVVLGLLLCAFGAVLLFRRDRFEFDRTRRTVRWRKWSLARTSSGEIAFSDILDVTLESIGTHEGSGTYRVALRTADRTVPLTETYSGKPDRWRPTIDRIRTIVGLKDPRPTDADTDSLVSQGRFVDAVRQLRETEGLDIAQARARADAARSRAD